MKYSRHWFAALTGCFDRFSFLHRVGSSQLWNWLPSVNRQKSVSRRIKQFSERLALRPAQRYLMGVSIFQNSLRRGLYRPEFASQMTSEAETFLESAWQRSAPRDAVAQASLTDLTTYLPCDLMTKVDIASMAHGLECRAPFLDYRVVEFAAALPSALKMRFGCGKRLLRAAFGHLLPQEVFTRRKMGFSVPLDHWFRDELKELASDLLLGSNSRCHEYLRAEAIHDLWQAHQQRRYDHSARLWSLIMLECWLREWGSNSSAAAGDSPAGRRNHSTDKAGSTET